EDLPNHLTYHPGRIRRLIAKVENIRLEHELDELTRFVKASTFLANQKVETLHTLIRALRFRSVPSNHCIVRQGEKEEGLYFLLCGRLAVYMDHTMPDRDLNTRPAAVEEARDAEWWTGQEDAFSVESLWQGSCMQDACELVFLSKAAYTNVMRSIEQHSRRAKVKFLQGMDVFSSLPRQSLERLCVSMTIYEFEEDEVVMTRGNPAHEAFAVHKGECFTIDESLQQDLDDDSLEGTPIDSKTMLALSEVVHSAEYPHTVVAKAGSVLFAFTSDNLLRYTKGLLTAIVPPPEVPATPADDAQSLDLETWAPGHQQGSAARTEGGIRIPLSTLVQSVVSGFAASTESVLRPTVVSTGAFGSAVKQPNDSPRSQYYAPPEPSPRSRISRQSRGLSMAVGYTPGTAPVPPSTRKPSNPHDTDKRTHEQSGQGPGGVPPSSSRAVPSGRLARKPISTPQKPPRLMIPEGDQKTFLTLSQNEAKTPRSSRHQEVGFRESKTPQSSRFSVDSRRVPTQLATPQDLKFTPTPQLSPTSARRRPTLKNPSSSPGARPAPPEPDPVPKLPLSELREYAWKTLAIDAREDEEVLFIAQLAYEQEQRQKSSREQLAARSAQQAAASETGHQVRSMSSKARPQTAPTNLKSLTRRPLSSRPHSSRPTSAHKRLMSQPADGVLPSRPMSSNPAQPLPPASQLYDNIKPKLVNSNKVIHELHSHDYELNRNRPGEFIRLAVHVREDLPSTKVRMKEKAMLEYTRCLFRRRTSQEQQCASM
ncbi:hypothetical protein CYMTET_32503, partial [Cymbomonas tetramitiformis]